MSPPAPAEPELQTAADLNEPSEAETLQRLWHMRELRARGPSRAGEVGRAGELDRNRPRCEWKVRRRVCLAVQLLSKRSACCRQVFLSTVLAPDCGCHREI